MSEKTGLAHERHGAGPLRLLLVHGLCGSRDIWTRQVERFASSFEIVAVDLPGHGSSAPCPGASLIQAGAAEATALLRELPPAPTVAVGHSLGGMVVQELVVAGRGLAGAVFLDSPCLLSGKKLIEYHLWKNRILDSENRPAMIQAWFQGFLTASCPASVREMILGEAGAFPPEWIADVMGGLRRPSTTADPVPVLVAEGEQYYPEGSELSWLTAYPGARRWKYPGYGHYYFVEDPRPFNDALEKFLRELSALATSRYR